MALLFPVMGAAINDWTAPARRPAVMGVWVTCQSVGGVAGSLLSAAVLERRGWRAAFTVSAAAVAMYSVAMAAALPSAPPPFATREVAASKHHGGVLGVPHMRLLDASYVLLKLVRYALMNLSLIHI